MLQRLLNRKTIFLTLFSLIALFFLAIPETFAVSSTGTFNYSVGYYIMAPSWLNTNPNDPIPDTPTCPDTSGCVNLNLCFNSWAVGQTDCGNACSDGNAWTKYSKWGCFLKRYDQFSQEGECETTYIRDDNTYSIGDKYNSGNTPVMNAGNCNLNVGGPYKTCCLGTTPVSARNLCSSGSPLCDPYDPPEADCGGYTTIRCGGGGEPACGQAACNTLAPPPTCDQSCTSWTNSDCGNDSNGCSSGQRKQTRSCSLAGCSTSQCVDDSGCVPRSCTPGVDTQICDTGWCPNGSVCAQGHKYCLWDGSGYGECSEEINNCSTQCAAPPPPPAPGNCSFSSCGANGCGSDQRYVSGDKCYSDYSWYVGAGCYHDGSCSGGGTTSSVSCSATTPVMRGSPVTISVTQRPNKGDDESCYYNRIDANVYLGSTPKGSCAATGFNPDNQTRSCTYTPTEAGNYSVGVYYGGHTDASGWDCWPTGPGGSWDSYECRWVQRCEDPQAWGNCNFTSIAMTPCPGGVNACGSSTYQGLSGCNGYWTYPNNTEYNRWCTANAGSSRPNCYGCNAWGPPPTIVSSSCTRNGSGQLNTANLYWNKIPGADPYISSQSPVYGYYNLIYGTSCNPSNPSTCSRVDNIYSTNETLNNIDFGEYTWAVQGCNAVTRTCSGWSSPAGSFMCNVDAWIQTTGGDVHSNIRINAPGGP